MKAPDIVGQRFGRLVVIRRHSNNKKSCQSRWLCQCDCGNTCIKPGGRLRYAHKKGRRQSCGCWRDELFAERGRRRATHGLTTGTSSRESRKIYDVWRQMLRRCENKKCKDYRAYGGRGIIVCKAWHDPNKFHHWCWKSGYEIGLTLERKNVNGHYRPGNCTWTPNPMQARNLRKNRIYTFKGRTLCLSEWARYLGFHYQTIKRRLNAGWSVRDAFTIVPIQLRSYL